MTETLTPSATIFKVAAEPFDIPAIFIGPYYRKGIPQLPNQVKLRNGKSIQDIYRHRHSCSANDILLLRLYIIYYLRCPVWRINGDRSHEHLSTLTITELQEMLIDNGLDPF